MYSVDFREQARKDLRRLPPKHVRQLQEKVDNLAENPRHHDCKRVISLPGYLRVDSGEYRVLYRVDDEAKLVIITRIRHRREAYR